MKPFLTGKKTADGEPLRSANTHPPMPIGGHVRQAQAGPNVEAVKEGDKVVRLIVTCCCGERIEIDCLYPVGS